ncbi:type IV pilin-like G/H family protein [Lyngbya aestuarii]|uniref:type IV pilin-like G/H family protein n=1 Tax=Lyngbya aestuarii TaxID=118322 RepID=UPI00403D5A34
MSRIIGNLLKHWQLLAASGKLITTGMFAVVVTALETSLVTQPAILFQGTSQTATAFTLAQEQDSSTTQTVAEQLLGYWQIKDPESGEVLAFIFAPNGDLFFVLPTPNGSSVALQANYQINLTTQPMQLDIQINSQEQALTIFEFTDDGQLRLELEGVEPGVPRPTAFGTQATVFEKTSPSTTVPENIQVIDLAALEDSDNQTTETPQDEAKKYLFALTRVQQAYYLEQGKFATNIEEVSIGLRTETESYSYKISSQGDNMQSVMITAVAKSAELPSYTGAVFVTENAEGEATTVTQICETNQPSMTPPAMPTAPRNGSEIQCPEASHSLGEKQQEFK